MGRVLPLGWPGEAQSWFLNPPKGLRKLMKGSSDLLEGRPNLLEGRRNLLEGRLTLLEGRPNLLEGHPNLLEGRRNLLEGRRNLLEGRQNLLEGRSNLLEGRRVNGHPTFPPVGQLIIPPCGLVIDVRQRRVFASASASGLGSLFPVAGAVGAVGNAGGSVAGSCASRAKCAA